MVTSYITSSPLADITNIVFGVGHCCKIQCIYHISYTSPSSKVLMSIAKERFQMLSLKCMPVTKLDDLLL